MALIPGILFEEKSLKDIGSHFDKPTLASLSAKRQPTDMGLIDLWASKHVKDIPLYAGMILEGDVMYTEESYTFSLPTATDTSTKIIENPNKGNKVGEGGNEFVLITNNAYIGGFGSIVTFDKMGNAPELEVTNVRDMGDKFAYTLKIAQGSTVAKHDYLPSEFLSPGSKIFKLAGIRASEFGQNWDSFSFKGGTEKKYIKQLATAELQIHYDMTREAVRFSNKMELSQLAARSFAEMKDSVTQYNFMDSPIDPQIKYMSEYSGPAQVQGSALIYTLDDLCLKILAKEKSEYGMWGKGAVVGIGDGLDQGRLPIGIYHQLDKSGYKDVFDLPSFGIHTLQNAYRRFTSGKQPVVEQGNEPIVRMRTGKGGLELVSPLIERFAISSLGGYQQQAATLNIITGDAKTGLGVNKPFYNQLRLPGVALFVFEYEPAFDPIIANDTFNPLMYTGYRLSSYTFLMDDYVMSRNNIKILRSKYGGGDVSWHVNPGTETHPFLKMNYMGHSGHLAASNKTGFSSYWTTRVDTPWVIDPTKLLKLVPKNPKLTNFTL